MAGEQVKDVDILHKPCQVVIKHSQAENGTIFANVQNVLPASQKKDVPFSEY